MTGPENPPDSLPSSPEPENPQVIHSVPLSAFIKTIERNVRALLEFSEFRQLDTSISEITDHMLREYPNLRKYVQNQISDANTPDEARLVGETALVVYQVVQATPPAIEELKVEGQRILRKDVENGSIAPVMEDDIFNRIEDNSVYQLLEQDMGRHPALATYIAQNMNRSTSPQTADLVGQTALVVYNTTNYILSRPTQ